MKSAIFKQKKNMPSLLWRCLCWHLRYFCTKKPCPLSCGMYITSACNLKCSFCNIWRKSNNRIIDFTQAKKMVDSLSELNCYYVSITGGEPLLVPHIFDLLAYAKKSRLKYVHMVTNGFLLDQEKARRLGKTGIDEVSISIDGSEQIHDTNRGVSGAYKRAVQAVTYLQEEAPRIQIVLNTVFFPDNPHACLHAVELAKKFNVSLKLQPVNQHPVFNKNNHSDIPARHTTAYNEQDIRKIIKQLCNEDCVINSPAFLKNMLNFYFNKDALIFRNSECLFGYHHIEILEDGTVFPCLEGLDWINGTSCSGDLKKLISTDAYRRQLHNLKACTHCSRNYYICYYEPRIVFPAQNLITYYNVSC
ncbi:MAG: radical SAM protein [bacterium]